MLIRAFPRWFGARTGAGWSARILDIGFAKRGVCPGLHRVACLGNPTEWSLRFAPVAAGEPCSGGIGQKASAGEATAGIDRAQEAIRSNTQQRVAAAATHIVPLAVGSRNASTASAWMGMAEIRDTSGRRLASGGICRYQSKRLQILRRLLYSAAGCTPG